MNYIRFKPEFPILIERECEICKEIYDGYSRTLYIQDDTGKKCVCQDCRDKLIKDKIWYKDYIPAFCEGADLVTRIFSNVQDLLEFVKNNTEEQFIATIDEYNTIVDVKENKEIWWVRGFVSNKLNLPDFDETIKKLNYK